jgi:hypothetical protein
VCKRILDVRAWVGMWEVNAEVVRSRVYRHGTRDVGERGRLWCVGRGWGAREDMCFVYDCKVAWRRTVGSSWGVDAGGCFTTGGGAAEPICSG